MFRTEWGFDSPWGQSSAADLATAERIVGNMRNAGHKASVIWRSVSDWQDAEEE